MINSTKYFDIKAINQSLDLMFAMHYLFLSGCDIVFSLHGKGKYKMLISG